MKAHARSETPSEPPVDARTAMVPGGSHIQAAGPRFPAWLLALFIAVTGMVAVAAMPAQAAAPEYEPEERASALARPGLVQVDIRWSGFVGVEGAGAEASRRAGPPIEFFLRCSGFYVNTTGRLVTAAGCLDPARARPFFLAQAEAAAAGPAARIEGDRTGVPGGDFALSVQWDQARPRTATATGGAPERLLDATVVGPVSAEVAVLQAGVPAGERSGDRPVVALGTAAEVRKGRPVVALGYPGAVDETDPAGGFPVDRWGAVLPTDGPDADRPFEVSAAAVGAMKGGPVIDMEGRAVGLSGFNADGSEETFPVVPAKAIVEALNATGTEAGTGPLDADYRAGLDHFYAGEMNEAIARLERVAPGPGRQDAAAFLARSRDLQKLDDQRGTGLPVLVVVVVILIAGATFLVIRNRTASRRHALRTLEVEPP